MSTQPMTGGQFYEMWRLPVEFGFTPTIAEYLGGVGLIDSYTPASTAYWTLDSYQQYLKRPTDNTSKASLVDYLYRVADQFGIDRDAAYQQIEAESNFNPKAVGKPTRYGTAKGIAQFIDATAQRYGLKDPFDPYASFDAWGQYMSDLLKMYGGDYARALAAYNWGQGNVDKAVATYGNEWLKNAPTETREYVAKILRGQAGDAATASPCGTFDIGCHLSEFLTGDAAKDVGKRIALLLVAVVLLAVAIISLR